MLIDDDLHYLYSKYPLTPLAKGYFGLSILFPYKEIISIIIQTPDIVDYYISSIKLYQEEVNNTRLNYVQLTFSSLEALDLYFCNIYLNSIQTVIFNKFNKLSGNMLYKNSLYNSIISVLFLLGLLILLEINPTILPISHNCVVTVKPTSTSMYRINARDCTLDVLLYFVNNANCTKLDEQDGVYHINVFGDCPLNLLSFTGTRVQRLYVCTSTTDSTGNLNIKYPDTYPVSVLNSSLYIKPSGLSDLRVITKDNKIKLIGTQHV